MSAAPAEARSRDFPGTIEAAVDAEAWLMSQSGDLGLEEDTRFAVSLCVEELFLNAVQHGHARSATVSLWREPDGARVEFIDDGQPFDPTTATTKRISELTDNFDIGGYGSGLVQKFSRSMTYRRSDGMNRLVLEFGASPGADASAGPERLSTI